MKLNSILTALLLLTAGACKKSFLDIPPTSSISSTTFYKTASDFQQAIVGVYAPLNTIYGATSEPDYGAWAMGEMRSDNTCFIFNSANRGWVNLEQVDQFLDDGNSLIVNKYNSDYTLIGRANQVLSSIDAASFDAALKSKYKGEALFLRSFAYFDLVQYYGDVPLTLKPAMNLADTQTPRTAKDKVMTQIIADLKLAVSLLPAKALTSPGHVSANTANMLLGNIYIVLKQWPAAETALQLIVSSGEFSLLPDYGSIYQLNNKNNAESIFEVQYDGDPALGLQNAFGYNFLPALADPGVIAGYPHSSGNTGGGWNIPTPDLINSYEIGDARKTATISYVAVNGITYPYLKKYVQGAAIYPFTDNDWMVYRYSETLLFLAEALNEDGKSGAAIPYINQVRARAGLSGVLASDQAGLRTAIMHERQVELAGENKRWPDLVRTGTAIQVMNAQGAAIKANPTAYYYPAGVSILPAAFTLTSTRLLFPIPNREILLNPQLIQNPGY